MERDELIIWMYLWVCEQMAQVRQQLPNGRLRRGGFAPRLSDEEALTIELCGEMLRLHSDKAILAHFQTYYPGWFPHLRERTSFVRQIANLWWVKQQLLARLLCSQAPPCSTDEPTIEPVDTLPLPICAKVRARRAWNFAGGECARKGFCAAKDTFYYGFKLGLRVSERGLIRHFALLHANTNDSRHLPALVEGYQGLVAVDKGFFDPMGWRLLARHGVHIVGRAPKRIENHRPLELRLNVWTERLCARVRKVVECVGALLCGRFAIDRIRVHDLWHFEHRLLRKILAFNLLLTCNIALGRPPLDLDGLLRD